jgi:drug/metabolite transporter (DMT)-like permease
MQDVGPMPTSILGALEPVTALVVGVVVFGEVLTPMNIAGVILVIVAVTLLVAGKYLLSLLARH